MVILIAESAEDDVGGFTGDFTNPLDNGAFGQNGQRNSRWLDFGIYLGTLTKPVDRAQASPILDSRQGGHNDGQATAHG